MNHERKGGLYSVVTCSLIAASHLPAQVASEWTRGDAFPGVDGSVHALVSWDPDGSGPSGPMVVIGGSFEVAGSVIGRHIAAWDPATDEWSAFDAGFDAPVHALAVMPNGDLIAGGSFIKSRSVAIEGVARWDGRNWQPLGAGMTGTVSAMAVSSTGRLAIAGEITTAGGWPCGNVAEWDGVTLYPLTLGMDGPVRDLVATPNGRLVAVGAFLQADNMPCSRVAEWTGTGWAAMGTGFDDDATSVVARPNGDVIVGGAFQAAGATACVHVARWSGGAWQPHGFFDDVVERLFVDANGDVVASGDFAWIDTTNAPRLARHDGVAWSAFPGDAATRIRALLPLPGGAATVVGGDFTAIGGVRALHLAICTGATWASLGDGFDGTVNALASAEDVGVVAGGAFRLANGAACSGLARRVDGTWQDLPGLEGNAAAVAVLDDGETIVAGGEFLVGAAGNGTTTAVAAWRQGGWQPLGKHVRGVATALRPLPGGRLLVAGSLLVDGFDQYAVSEWDGAAWQPVGKSVDGVVRALEFTADGSVVAGGSFTQIDGTAAANVARKVGSAWQPLGPGVDGVVHCVLQLGNGDLLVGGSFQHAGPLAVENVARFDGTSWHPVGAGLDDTVYCLRQLGDGDVFAGGAFRRSGQSHVRHVARLRQGAWRPVDAGVDGCVRAMTILDEGALAIGGDFVTSHRDVQPHVAVRRSLVRAAIRDIGPGCAPAGPGSLMICTAPWIDRACTITAQGVPATALAFTVFGLAPRQRPLSTWFAAAVPGCSLLVDAAVIVPALGAGAARSSTWHVPDDLALLGAAFLAQMLVLDFDQAGLADVTSTNASWLRIGAF